MDTLEVPIGRMSHNHAQPFTPFTLYEWMQCHSADIIAA